MDKTDLIPEGLHGNHGNNLDVSLNSHGNNNAASTDKDLLICSICRNLIEDPRHLSCLHTFCYNCLESTRGNQDCKDSTNNVIWCPTCRQISKLSNGGMVIGLPRNIIVAQMIEEKTARDKLRDNSAPIECTNCTRTVRDAVARCVACDDFMCQGCLESHNMIRALKQHLVITITEFKAGKMPNHINGLPRIDMCSTHKQEPIRFYCETCGVVMCRDCTVVDHPRPEHRHVDIEEGLRQQQRNIRLLMNQCSRADKNVQSGIERSNAVLQNVKMAVSDSKEALNKCAEDIKSKFLENLERNRHTIESELSEMGITREAVIRRQMERLTSVKTRLDVAMNLSDALQEMTLSQNYSDAVVAHSMVASALRNVGGEMLVNTERKLASIEFIPSISSGVLDMKTLTHLGKVCDGSVEDEEEASSSSGTTSSLSSPFIPHQSNDTQSIISTDSLSEKDPYDSGLGQPGFARHYSTADTHSMGSIGSTSEMDPYEVSLGPPTTFARYSTADTHLIGSIESNSEMGRYKIGLGQPKFARHSIVDTQSMGSVGSTSEIDLFEFGRGGPPTFSSTRNIASQCRKPIPMIRTNSKSLPNLTLLPMTTSVIEIDESTDDDVVTQRKENHPGSDTQVTQHQVNTTRGPHKKKLTPVILESNFFSDSDDNSSAAEMPKRRMPLLVPQKLRNEVSPFTSWSPTTECTLERSFGHKSDGETAFAWGVCTNSDGEIIVTNQQSALGMSVFGPDGRYRRFLATRAKNRDVVVINDEYFVTSRTKFVRVYNRHGRYLRQFHAVSPTTSTTSTRTVMYTVNCMAKDPVSELLVLGASYSRSACVSIHRPDGSHVSSFKIGIEPTFIAVTSRGNVVVSSHTDRTVWLLDPANGCILNSIDPPPAHGHESNWQPSGVCCSRTDDIYVANRTADDKRGVYRYTEMGRYVGCITTVVGSPHGLALTDDDQRLLVADYQSVKVFQLRCE